MAHLYIIIYNREFININFKKFKIYDKVFYYNRVY